MPNSGSEVARGLQGGNIKSTKTKQQIDVDFVTPGIHTELN